MAQVHGHCDPKFAKLRDLMQEFLASGHDIGASLCLNTGGGDHDVVDIWGGRADAASSTPWTRDTIVNVFSTTKLVTQLAAAMLISPGALRPRRPRRAALARVLAHTAGLCAGADDLRLEDRYDATTAAERLAARKPLWEPGSAVGYHGLTQGVIVGELVRRVTGTTIDRFPAEEVRRPLGREGKLPAGVAWGSGWGGSFVVMDAQKELTIAYAMNRMANGEQGTLEPEYCIYPSYDVVVTIDEPSS
ncbi:beta-lactamase [Cordyceps fumosorosea ARSEF 2679]|uniref:Beta-lactamase n=1 Tax=Cordyceps fumosorosea (strain ARSEF 2679) TaxID=1081104 RepID=A0A168CF38_CORFA|nr:beta-lactamase [Cordyceps fumosorosea ARSEF 2679]OAA71301.1 beta-lactamase [Cordyceps fumosorosea ARSEF 2679]